MPIKQDLDVPEKLGIDSMGFTNTNKSFTIKLALDSPLNNPAEFDDQYWEQQVELFDHSRIMLWRVRRMITALRSIDPRHLTPEIRALVMEFQGWQALPLEVPRFAPMQADQVPWNPQDNAIFDAQRKVKTFAECPDHLLRYFPAKIPWELAERAYESYARKHGRGQSLERLNERGGFSFSELLDEGIPEQELIDGIKKTRFILQGVVPNAR